MTKPTRRNSLIVTIPLVVVAVAWTTLVFLPIQKAIGRLEEEANQMRQFCDQSTLRFPILKRTGRELGETRQRISYWDETTPTGEDLPALLGKITSLARTSGLRITRFDPEPMVTQLRIAQLPVSMGVTGPFNRVFTFLGGMEKMPQTIWVESLKIDKKERDSKDVYCEIRMAIFMDNPENSDQRKDSDYR